jgi:hypothetical protein
VWEIEMNTKPNVYTTTEEIDTFVTAMLDAANNGAPPLAVGDRGTEPGNWVALDEPGDLA